MAGLYRGSDKRGRCDLTHCPYRGSDKGGGRCDLTHGPYRGSDKGGGVT